MKVTKYKGYGKIVVKSWRRYRFACEVEAQRFRRHMRMIARHILFQEGE